MDSAQVIARLKAMEPELRSAGLDALYLFGSRARGDERPDSDVDLLFDAKDQHVDYLSLLELKRELAVSLEAPVDLVERAHLHVLVRPFVEPDLVRIF